MDRTFLARVGSSVLLFGAILGGIFLNEPTVFLAVLVAVAVFGLREFYSLAQRGGIPSFRLWGLAGGVVLVSGNWFFAFRGFPAEVRYGFETLVLTTFVLGVFLRQLPQKHNPRALATMTCTVFGLLYVPWLLSFITKIHYLGGGGEGRGRFLVLYLIAVTKLTDVGAYTLGSAFGRHPLLPRISPRKTWEGVVGGVATATAGSLLAWKWLGSRLSDLPGIQFRAVDAAVLGVLIGGAAVAGDLAESLIKRDVGAKDSGNIVPGIGGVLDLVDSLLFSAPLLFVYVLLVLQ